MEIDSCFTRALAIGRELRQFAKDDGATDEEAFRLFRVAISIFPMILWQIDSGIQRATPDGIVWYSKFRTTMGFAAKLLQHRQTPGEIARSVFPTLRPERHEAVAVWWDEVARPRWLAPCVDRARLEGRFEGMILRDAEPRPPEDLRAWGAAHFEAWKENVFEDGKFLRV